MGGGGAEKEIGSLGRGDIAALGRCHDRAAPSAARSATWNPSTYAQVPPREE